MRPIREREKEFKPKPDWLKTRIPFGRTYFELKSNLEKRNLSTICQSARCPNINECWNQNHATFLIMGDTCTRNCSFCSVRHSSPAPLDENEPSKIVEMAEIMKLRHVVITSVTRDDLEDGGAGHYSRTIKALKRNFPDLVVEVLIPDFKGNPDSLDRVLDAAPDVVNHNLETVSRIYPLINRSAESYARSLKILKLAKARDFITKSGIMVGLGETLEECIDLFDDLRNAGVNFLTICQYMRPARENIPVSTYHPPGHFQRLRDIAQKKGFDSVESGSLVRSSYNAGRMYRRHKVS